MPEPIGIVSVCRVRQGREDQPLLLALPGAWRPVPAADSFVCDAETRTLLIHTELECTRPEAKYTLANETGRRPFSRRFPSKLTVLPPLPGSIHPPP